MAGVKRLMKEVAQVHAAAIADYDEEGSSNPSNGARAALWPSSSSSSSSRPPHVLQVSEWDLIGEPKFLKGTDHLLPIRLCLTVDPPPFFCHHDGEADAVVVAPLPDGLRPWPALVGVRLPLDTEYPNDFPFKPPKIFVPFGRVGSERVLCLPEDQAAKEDEACSGVGATSSRPGRTFADTLVVGSHPLDPAPWAPPSNRFVGLPGPAQSSASYGPASFAAASLLQQSVRFRIELLGATLTQIRWRAAMNGFAVERLGTKSTACDGQATLDAHDRNERELRRWLVRHDAPRRTSHPDDLDRRIVEAMLAAAKVTETSTREAWPCVRVLLSKVLRFPLRVCVPNAPSPFADDNAGTDSDDSDGAPPTTLMRVGLIHVKLFVQKREGIPLEQQRLLYSRPLLNDPEARFYEPGFTEPLLEHEDLDLIHTVRGCTHGTGLLMPKGFNHWTPGCALPTHLLPLINAQLFCAVGNDHDDADRDGCSQLYCRTVLHELIRRSLRRLLRIPGGRAMVPESAIDEAGRVTLTIPFLADADYAADRARIFDAVQWVLRCASPSPLVRWSPETDAQWPMLFRKIVRYVRRVRVPTPAGGGGAAVLPLEVVERVGEFL